MDGHHFDNSWIAISQQRFYLSCGSWWISVLLVLLK